MIFCLLLTYLKDCIYTSNAILINSSSCVRTLDSWDIIMLDSEAADNAESKASEVEQLRVTVSRYEEEHKLMTDEIAQLKEMLKREVSQAEVEKKANLAVISDYKLIRQRLENQLKVVKAELQALKVRFYICFQFLHFKWICSRKKYQLAKVATHSFQKSPIKATVKNLKRN